MPCVVRVVCGACRGKVGDVANAFELVTSRNWPNGPFGGRRFPCRKCGADYKVGRADLVAAFRIAEASNRRILLPLR